MPVRNDKCILFYYPEKDKEKNKTKERQIEGKKEKRRNDGKGDQHEIKVSFNKK